MSVTHMNIKESSVPEERLVKSFLLSASFLSCKSGMAQ